MAGALALFGEPPAYRYPRRGGFSQDAAKLRGDFAAVGTDLRETLERDAQKYDRPRQA